MKFGNTVITKTHVCALHAHENKTNKAIIACTNLIVWESQKYMKFVNVTVMEMYVIVLQAHEKIK